MKGFIINIEKAAEGNDAFRKVLFTSHYSQLVLMSLKPGEEIGEEVHGLDQFIRIEEGTGKAVIDKTEHPIEDGTAIVIPAGAKHNIINSSNKPLKLYTIYSPPNHKDGIMFETKEDAEKSEEKFDGKISA